MKRTVQMGRVGNNLPRPKGQRKNKHKFYELKLDRQQEKQKQMEASVDKQIESYTPQAGEIVNANTNGFNENKDS